METETMSTPKYMTLKHYPNHLPQSEFDYYWQCQLCGADEWAKIKKDATDAFKVHRGLAHPDWRKS
jgi:hypothetical protein